MPFRLLIIDDSPLYRLRLSQILSASDRLQLVGLAGDGREAIRLIGERKPEVVVLDLEMPGLDGLSVLRWTRAQAAPVPVVVCSGLAERESVFQALEAGASDFMSKPELRFAVRSEAFARELRARVEAAAEAHARPLDPARGQDAAAVLAATRFAHAAMSGGRRVRAIAVVGSAGGPAAVARLVNELRPTLGAPVIFALHMPRGFTRSFAERLSRQGRLDVREAEDGERLSASPAWVAPGGQHTRVVRDSEGRLCLRVAPAGADSFCAPSADRLLASVAAEFGAGALGVVLTGMGEDGREGARAVRERGGTVIVESRDSAAVWGMPRAVLEAGHADAELSLSAIAAALPLLCERADSPQRHRRHRDDQRKCVEGELSDESRA
ncbi:MAG: chemotaxis-specific protein-glutamate methyltransferase CheB [Acidobacteria bacterium]|nr:chemotaxis-specific protein-glutamate methyltransferase CheB [Acidobacteriota bacterium]